MELRDFVTRTLTQLIDGIRDAQTANSGGGALINPKGVSGGAAEHSLFCLDSNRHVSLVEFNISVTTEETGKAGVSAGVFVGSAQLGLRASKKSTRQEAGSIRFTVPVAFPSQ